jgi:hypothetical protein
LAPAVTGSTYPIAGDRVAEQIERRFSGGGEYPRDIRTGALFAELGQQVNAEHMEHVCRVLCRESGGIFGASSNSGVMASRCSTAARMASAGKRPVWSSSSWRTSAMVMASSGSCRVA